MRFPIVTELQYPASTSFPGYSCSPPYWKTRGPWGRGCTRLLKNGAGKEWYSSTSFRGLSLQLRHHLNRCWLSKSIDSTGGWLGKPANLKVENNGAVVYVGSSLTVHNALFFVHKLWLKKKKAMFQLVSKFKMIKMLLQVVHRQVHKNQEHRSLTGFITIPL